MGESSPKIPSYLLIEAVRRAMDQLSLRFVHKKQKIVFVDDCRKGMGPVMDGLLMSVAGGKGARKPGAMDSALDSISPPATVIRRLPFPVDTNVAFSQGAVNGRKGKVFERLAEHPVESPPLVVGAKLHGKAPLH